MSPPLSYFFHNVPACLLLNPSSRGEGGTTIATKGNRRRKICLWAKRKMKVLSIVEQIFHPFFIRTYISAIGRDSQKGKKGLLI